MGKNTGTNMLAPKILASIGEFFYRGKRKFSRERPAALLRAKRILVLRLDKIGDVVMTSAFLRELRRNAPDARITLVVNPQVYPLVEYCPHVNEVLTFDWASFVESSRVRRHIHGLRYARRHLWQRSFDLTVIPRWDVDFYHENYLAYYSGAPWRVAYTERTTPSKSQLNAGENRLFTRVIEEYALQHEVAQNLNVIRFLGGSIRDRRLELWLTREDESSVETFLQSQRWRRSAPLIALGIGAGDPKRIWPLEKYTEVARWLHEQYHAEVLVVGTADEQTSGHHLAEQCGEWVINAIGRSDLRQTGALLKRCHLFIGNDSGPMHMAVGAGIPVVEISAHPGDGAPDHYNSPVRFGPWQVPQRILQPESALDPCIDACEATTPHCIRRITVQQVQEAVRSLMTAGTYSSKNTSADMS